MTVTTSEHFDKTIAVVFAVAAFLFGLFFYARHSIESAKNPPRSILAPKDKEAILYNSVTHMLTVSTETGTKTEYARNPVIHLQKDGTVKIDRKVYGLEHSPFGGYGYGDGVRLYVGMSWAYIYRLDVNTQLGVTDNRSLVAIRAVSSLSYNFYSNTSAFVGVEPLALLTGQPRIHAGVIVRF